jgi:hypothetical protein
MSPALFYTKSEKQFTFLQLHLLSLFRQYGLIYHDFLNSILSKVAVRKEVHEDFNLYLLVAFFHQLHGCFCY